MAMQNEFGEIVKNTKKKQVDFGISLKCRWNTKLNASTLANISFLVFLYLKSQFKTWTKLS